MPVCDLITGIYSVLNILWDILIQEKKLTKFLNGKLGNYYKINSNTLMKKRTEH